MAETHTELLRERAIDRWPEEERAFIARALNSAAPAGGRGRMHPVATILNLGAFTTSYALAACQMLNERYTHRAARGMASPVPFPTMARTMDRLALPAEEAAPEPTTVPMIAAQEVGRVLLNAFAREREHSLWALKEMWRKAEREIAAIEADPEYFQRTDFISQDARKYAEATDKMVALSEAISGAHWLTSERAQTFAGRE